MNFMIKRVFRDSLLLLIKEFLNKNMKSLQTAYQ